MHILDNVLVQREFEERFLNGNVRRKGAGGMSVWFFFITKRKTSKKTQRGRIY